MTKLTLAQKRAVRALYLRMQKEQRPSYKEFRASVTPELAGFGAVMVPWCGMWIGIEKDGYTHS